MGCELFLRCLIFLFIVTHLGFGLGSLAQVTVMDMISHTVVSMSIFQHFCTLLEPPGDKFLHWHMWSSTLWRLGFVQPFSTALSSPALFFPLMRFHTSNVAVIWYLDLAVWNPSKCTIQCKPMQWLINYLILVEFEESTLSMIKGSCHSSDDQTKFADWKQVKVKYVV